MTWPLDYYRKASLHLRLFPETPEERMAVTRSFAESLRLGRTPEEAGFHVNDLLEYSRDPNPSDEDTCPPRGEQ